MKGFNTYLRSLDVVSFALRKQKNRCVPLSTSKTTLNDLVDQTVRGSTAGLCRPGFESQPLTILFVGTVYIILWTPSYSAEFTSTISTIERFLPRADSKVFQPRDRVLWPGRSRGLCNTLSAGVRTLLSAILYSVEYLNKTRTIWSERPNGTMVSLPFSNLAFP